MEPADFFPRRGRGFWEEIPVTLVWTRVDQKLIHGQVVVAWVPRLKIDAIVVSDQDTAEDPWSQKVMLLGLPPEIQVALFTSPDKLADLLAEKRLASRRVLVLFKNLSGFLDAVGAGLRPTVLNLGNQASQPPDQSIRLTDSFYASLKELADLSSLARSSGLEVILQAVPAGKAIMWKPQ
jgi:PTS system mannose-specific IIB component